MSVLNHVSLFEDLSADVIEQAFASTRHYHYKQGEYLFNTGEQADTLFLLLDGLVKITYITMSGDENILDIFESGDIFGELWLGKYRHRIGHAIALKDTVACKLTEPELYALIQKYPAMGINFIKHLVDERRENMARMHALLRADATCRLLGTLLSLSRRHCCITENGLFQLDQNITQEDIANITGLNRSTVSSLINKLRREGVLGGTGRILNINVVEVEKRLEAAGFELLE